MPASTYLAISRREGALAGLALLISGAVPRGKRLPKLCLFNHVTGYPCPFCGLTRGFVDIGHGDLASAERHHLLALPGFSIFMAASALLVFRERIRIPLSRPLVLASCVALLVAWMAKLAFVSRRYW